MGNPPHSPNWPFVDCATRASAFGPSICWALIAPNLWIVFQTSLKTMTNDMVNECVVEVVAPLALARH